MAGAVWIIVGGKEIFVGAALVRVGYRHGAANGGAGGRVDLGDNDIGFVCRNRFKVRPEQAAGRVEGRRCVAVVARARKEGKKCGGGGKVLPAFVDTLSAL